MAASVIATLISSVLSTAAAGAILLLDARRRASLARHLTAFASGTLLGGAFLGLLPEALERAAVRPVLSVALAGVVGAFVLEKLVLWRHCHADECHTHVAGPLVLAGDGLHNFLDGVAIAAAFAASPALGIVAALAIAAHEIPQELGDFAILIDAGWTRRSAFVGNLVSASLAIVGAVAGTMALQAIASALPFLMAVSAATFVYIALADLVPSLHRRRGGRDAALQLVLVVSGIALIAAVHA